MKKLGLLVMPLMVPLFLANCGGAKPDKTYNVTVGKTDHLNFTTLDGGSLNNTKAYENKDFKFIIKAYNDATSTYNYIVPTLIDISINDAIPLYEGYKIEATSETEAIVTVEADKIIGDIVVGGDAGIKDAYRYRVSTHYGLNEIPSGIKNLNEMLQLQFVASDTYSLPKAENIYIYFDGTGEWVTPSDSTVQREYCTYNNQTGYLTIKPYHIVSNIDIKARATDFPLLEKLTWDEINSISFAGIAKHLFYVGEEKTVLVNNQNHKVRIIDFDHDKLSSDPSKKAGITFEFVNLLSDSNGYSLATPYNWDGAKGDATPTNGDYINSSFRKALDGNGNGTIHWYRKEEKTESQDEMYKNKSVFEMLPSDLQVVLKEVTKLITEYNSSEDKFILDKTSYKTKVFTLSFIEVTSNRTYNALPEGRVYSYYIDTSYQAGDWIKKQVKGNDGAITVATNITDKKWTDESVSNFAGINYDEQNGGWYRFRTPCSYPESPIPPDTFGATWVLTPAGQPVNPNSSVYNMVMPFAPAFCI